MSKKQRLRGLLVFVSAFFVMFTAVLSSTIDNNIMKAETAIDDSPSGERIVDISYSGSGNIPKLFLTDDGGVYQGVYNGGKVETSKVLNVLEDRSENKYLSNIKIISGTGHYQSGNTYHAVAISNDDFMYTWEINANTEVIKEKLSFSIEKILVVDTGFSNFGIGGLLYVALSNNGEIYIRGDCTGGGIPCGIASGTDTTNFVKVTNDEFGNPLPKIKDFEVYSLGISLLTEDGEIYSTGSFTGNGTNDKKTLFSKAKFDLHTDVSNILAVYKIATIGFIAVDNSNNVYSSFDKSKNLYYTTLLKNNGHLSDPYNTLSNFKHFINSNSFSTGAYFLTQDNKVYTFMPPKGASITGGLENSGVTIAPVNDVFLTQSIDASSIEKIYGGYWDPSASITFLTKNGAVYYNDKKLSFGYFEILAKKADGSIYEKNEKYNDAISFDIDCIGGNTLDKISYKMTDHINASNSISTETPAEASYSIPIEDEKRIYRTYDFYITGEEEDTKTSFTVDLYKKALSLSDVKESGKYAKGKTITLPTSNGFAENTVSATLTKDSGTPTAYTSGTAINVAGNYVIAATDLYGNNVTYNFSVVDVPVPEGVAFTKGSGELTYGNAITKINGIVGSFSLTYAEGMDTSTIKTLTLGTGGNESNFEIVNTNQLKVKGSDLTAQEYTVNVSGTDQNDMDFTGSVTFTIAKGTQTMDFDSATKAFSSGKKMGDVFTLGTSNVLGGATVTYSADSCATMSSNQATITCVPTSGKITFTASAAVTTNYDTKSVTLEIPVSSLAVSLKTQVLEGSTYKDTTKIKVGDALPNAKVTIVSPSGFDATKLGTPSFTYKKAGVAVAKPQNTAGTYDVDVSFASSDGYSLTITKGTLVVEDIVLDEDTKDDYYTLTSGGKAYTPGTWTKDPILITPKHASFNKMQVDGGSVTTSAYTYQAEGSKDVTLSFENIDNIKITTKVKLNYDKTAPTMNDFNYEKPKSKLRAAFDHFFGEQKTVVFDAEDVGSGVKTYDYEIYEVDSDGNKITSTKKTGQGTSYTLAINKAYEINAKATDNAGNISSTKTERVTLSDNIGKLDISAKSDGKTYDGTKWVSKAIDLTLNGTNVSGVVKYQYSEDGIVFHDLTGDSVSLPSPLANVNNKAYTFRAINNDGSQNDETFSMKVEMEKPVISVKGKVSGGDYDGSEVGEDVEIIPSQTKASISGITYYYTKDESAKDSNPLTNSKWTKQSGTILESTNGTHTYYVKGVSGSGLISDVQSITVKILKRNYTSVNVSVTSGGKTYTPDTWAKGDVTFKVSGGIADASMITGYEYAITSGAKPTTSTTWKSVTGTTLTLSENIKGQTYYFRVLPEDHLGSVSKGTIVKLDVEKPSTPSITMKVLNEDPIAKFVNAMSFGNWMKESVEVTITSTDSVSGLDYYTYSETIKGVKTDKVSKTGVITYDKDTKLNISATAMDKAGNVSDDSESKEVMIDKEPPVIVGVKDQGEYKHYYLPRFISTEDALSGVKEASTQRNSETAIPFTNEISIKEVGTYTVRASDNADNTISLIFKLVPLPSFDEIDGSDESKSIIDQVQKELDEIKHKIDETESSDYEDWIEDATDKWESLRKKVIEDDGKTSKVEGVGDTSFDPKLELIVEPIEESKLPVLPRKALYSYDVYLRKGTTIVQPNGDIKVYLPYPEKETPIVYEIGKARAIQEIPAQKEGNFVTFTTSVLQQYAISNTEQELTEEPKDEVIKVPGPDGELDTKDDVIANPSDDGDKPTQNPDGTVNVPPGGSVTYPDGTEIETPEGGILNPDGSLTLPDGTQIDPTGKPKPDKDINQDSDEDGKADVNVDVDCDGKADINLDTNNDGIPDINIDTTGDGKPNYNVDLDGDEKPDLNIGPVKWKSDKCVTGGCVLYCTSTYYKPYLNIDTDGDQRPDVNVDTNKDMDPELNVDIDGDFIPDIEIDSDGDSKADINIDLDGDGWPDKNLALIMKWKPTLDVDQPMKYDTMSDIIVDESLTPDTWQPSQDINGGSQGGNDESTSTKDSTENKAFGGASTGDTTKLISLWSMLFFSIGATYISYRLKKNLKR